MLGSYFKPLRKKIGVGTLVMACLFAMGWVRSLTVEDEVYFPSGKMMPVLAYSSHGYIVWAKFGKLDWKDLEGQPPFWRSSKYDSNLGSREPLFDNPGFTWRWW